MAMASGVAGAGIDCEVAVALVLQLPSGEEALRIRVHSRGKESVVEKNVAELVEFDSPAIALAELARKAAEELKGK